MTLVVPIITAQTSGGAPRACDLQGAILKTQNPSRKYRFLRPVDCSRGASTPERRSKKQSAGRHEAFRRSNSAFLTLVGKGDAKSRHSEILIVAAVTGFEIQRRIDDYTAGNRFSVKGSSDRTLFPDGGEFICMVFLAEDEVPGEVRHQTDVAGHPKFQSRADLTERSDVMVVNRISGQVFALTGNEGAAGDVLRGGAGRGAERVFLIKKLIEGRAAVNEADAAGDIGSKAAERIPKR